ncbi:MAG: hypothetical protein AAFW89_08005 [Bacteroidota bacterium]
MLKKSSTLLLLFLLITTVELIGQITIAPTNLFIDSRSKFGTYLVLNGTNEPQEITIEFLFGYSDSDENGARAIVYDNPELEAVHSAADWVKAFPKTFVLSPGQRQVVRLRMAAPNNLDEGTYWSRIKTTAVPQSAPIELQAGDAVSASVGIRLEQVTGLYYKVGDVGTGIEIGEMKTDVTNNTLKVVSDLKRTGNSPFLGTVTLVVKDGNGREVTSGFVSTTIFFDGAYAQDIDISSLNPGTYTVDIQFESRRNDVSSDDLVQMSTISKSASFNVN